MEESDLGRAAWLTASADDLTSMVSSSSDFSAVSTVRMAKAALCPEVPCQVAVPNHGDRVFAEDKEAKIADSVLGKGQASEVSRAGSDSVLVRCNGAPLGSVGPWQTQMSMHVMSPAAMESREVSACIGCDDACDDASMRTSMSTGADRESDGNAAKEQMQRYRIDLFLDHRDADLKEHLGRWLSAEQLKSFGVGVKNLRFEVEGHSWHWARSS